MTDFDAGIGVILVLISFLALIIFIAKWEPVFSPYRPTTDDIPEVPMVGIQLPFTIQIIDAENASLTGGIKVRLKTEQLSMLHTFWGVECTTVQHLLQIKPLQLIQQANSLLQGKCLAENYTLCFQEGGNEELLIRLPEEADQLSLGPPPRSRYPLCLVIKTREPEMSTSQPCVVGSLILIHVPDTTLQEKCHMISQILVTNRGQAHNLQSLYMATDGEQNELSSNLEQPSSTRTQCETHSISSGEPNNYTTDGETQPTTDRETDGNGEVPRDCTVCQNAPISRVILPCRHACVCISCFPLLNRCPMCRGVIYSFFSMGTDLRYRQNLQEGTDEEKDWMGKIEDSCERLNQWLGFNQ